MTTHTPTPNVNAKKNGPDSCTPILCKWCKKRPKEQIWSMGWSDKDDELYLWHWCNKENKKVYSPQFGKHPFTSRYIKGQRPLVVAAWNQANAQEVA